ncbi:Uncharacterized protein TCM_034063 [Theobroma cacao]|uniref:Uncharacterized protein n=1 Tax=Theobroma cacao TaxID=3641 RepID=A0A061FDL7_THECC|nr:Uncharacterized protein TCM_034063 [Theobroma cacao]
MGDQRQMFRFRLPWLSAAAAPRPAAQPQPRPAAQTQAPAQPTTTIPIQRPPFRPAGIAPVQATPSQGQAPPQKAEPPPAATSRAATESKATLRPASPPRLTTQIRAASVPPSPSPRATETQVTSQPVAPTRAPTQARVASVPPSPSRIASQPQSTAQTVSEQQSPSRLASQPPGQTSSQPSSPSRRATQERSQPPSSTLPPLSASQETTFRPFGVAVEPSQASAQAKEVAPIIAATETPSAPLKPKEREERKKAAEERRKAKTKGSTHEEPEQRTITKLLAAAADAGTKTRELLGAAFETGIRHQEKQEDIERKKIWTTSSTDEKQIKTVSSTYPKEGSTPTNSHQKHATSTWEQVPLHKEIREDISKFVHKMATGQPKLPTDEKSIAVLTLAGENRGASFYMGSESAKKDGLVHIHRGYKINPDDSPDATTTDGEGSSRGRKPKDSMTRENPAPRAYVNSNTQSINNSVVFESSVNERNPGVHLEFLQNSAEPTKSNAKAGPLETRKAEFNVTPAEKLTYEPTVRRRCLRGLFAEPSDSDPDNPEKPRRHGCRYSCGEKNKETEIGVL